MVRCYKKNIRLKKFCKLVTTRLYLQTSKVIYCPKALAKLSLDQHFSFIAEEVLSCLLSKMVTVTLNNVDSEAAPVVTVTNLGGVNVYLFCKCYK